MKTKFTYMMVVCMVLFTSCDKDEIGIDDTILPPVEEPGVPQEPSTNDLIKVKVDNNIMATIGSNNWNSISYGNGKYVAVGNGGYVTTSTDGINWSTPLKIGNQPSSGLLDRLVSVTHGKGMFIAVGNADVNINYARFTTSTDGINWTVYKKILSGANVGNAQDIIFVNDKFVFLTSNEFITSSDGINWNKLSDMPITAYKIIYGNGKYVVSGKGEVATSSDGVTWTSTKLNDIDFIYCVAYGNGTFVLISDNGIVYTSTDGTSWTHATTIKLPPSVDASWCEWNSLRFIDNVFIAVGGSSYKEQNMCAYSTDGINWKIANELTGNGSSYHDLCAVR